MSDLIQRLKTGCVPRQTRREDTPEDLNEPFNIGATNALMAEAAAEIERLNILIDGAFFDLKDARQEAAELRNEAAALKLAIIKHHEQRADDRCIEDDDRLYAAAGLPVQDGILLANDRVKIVIAAGGDTKTGTFHITIG